MYNTLIFTPLYNILVEIMNIIPGIGLGVAVIIFTVVVKVILFPLTKKALITQVKMKAIEPEVNKIRLQYANNKQEQAIKIMEFYKAKNIKPLFGVLLMFIQLPILFALISVIYHVIPEVNSDYLYSFVSVPHISTTLFGIDITNKSLVLALLVAISQFIQLKYSVSMRQQKSVNDKILKNGGKLDASSEIANNLNSQMKIMMPILAFVSVYWLIPIKFPAASSVIAIYWIVSSIFTLVQELYIKRKHLGEDVA